MRNYIAAIMQLNNQLNLIILKKMDNSHAFVSFLHCLSTKKSLILVIIEKNIFCSLLGGREKNLSLHYKLDKFENNYLICGFMVIHISSPYFNQLLTTLLLIINI